MKKEVKIILNSGISININENDRVIMSYDLDNKEITDVEFEDIKLIAPSIMSKTGDIWLKHYISTGEYMEYYLTREKITWCYYSEVPDEDSSKSEK